MAALTASKQFAKDEQSGISVVGSSVWQSPRAVFELEFAMKYKKLKYLTEP